MVAGPQPATTLKWMGYSPGYQTVIDLALGIVELSHRGLDALGRGRSTEYLRHALVQHGVLDARGEQAARFDRMATAALAQVTSGDDRTVIRAFAVWRVQHDLVRRERTGRATANSSRHSVQLVQAAIALSTWTRQQGLTLAHLRQQHLDQWLAEGSWHTERIGPFLRWAARGGHTPKLDCSRHPRGPQVAAIDDGERVALTARLLHDDNLDLRDRVAGCLVLIYAQPASRIVTLTVDDVTHTPERIVRLRLGRVPIELPEPLSDLVARLAADPPQPLSTATAGIACTWLFASKRIGQPMTNGHLTRRLRRIGVRPLAGRTGAILNLAGMLPPSILAELLGIAEGTASDWQRIAGGEWAHYTAA